MPTYVAFLRAINLGPRRRFAKADIIAATEAAGGSDVATHINTGNVRLTIGLRSRVRVEAALETAYAERAGFEVPTIVFTPAEIRTIVDDAREISRGRPGAHYVSLLKDPPTAAATAQLETRSDDRDLAAVRGRAVHLVVTDPYHQARLSNADVEKALGVATNRNLRVIQAVAEKWC